jgi:hypothetical protein
MTEKQCTHHGIRKYNGIRCCLACGEAVFEASSSKAPAASQATDVPSHYQYNNLDYKLGQEIRLILLLPGGQDDPIRCDIIHVNLEDDPDYEAVSYTWATENGDSSLSQAVHCVCGGCIAVTANCAAVLRQLRRPGIRRRLWVDAICRLHIVHSTREKLMRGPQ